MLLSDTFGECLPHRPDLGRNQFTALPRKVFPILIVQKFIRTTVNGVHVRLIARDAIKIIANQVAADAKSTWSHENHHMRGGIEIRPYICHSASHTNATAHVTRNDMRDN